MILVFKFHKKPLTILLITLFFTCLVANKLAKEAYLHIDQRLIKLTILSSFRYIIVGVLFALHPTFGRRLLAKSSILIPIAILLFIILLPLTSIHSAIIALFFSAAEAISYGLLVIWFIENPEKCPLLRWKWVQWIGACSYSIYLWQQLFTGEATVYNTRSIAQSPFAIFAILACAALSYYFVELPSIRLGRFLSKAERR